MMGTGSGEVNMKLRVILAGTISALLWSTLASAQQQQPGITIPLPNVPGVTPPTPQQRPYYPPQHQIEAHFGFAQPPNVPGDLGRANVPGLELDPNQLSFFIGRANVKSSSRPGMARWRERLYSALVRIATRPTEFFRIPADRVIELGAEVEI